MRTRAHRGKTWASIGQLLTGLASLVFVFFEYLKGGTTNDPILLSVFFLFASTIVIDKVGQIFTSYSSERDEDEFRDLFDRLPGNLAGRNDIVAFPNDGEASRYCAAIVPLAISVKNTVLRYDYARYDLSDNSDYTEWRTLKIDSIRSKSCSWMEIISAHIDPTDYQRDVISQFSKIGRSKYDWRFLDEEKTPMIQMSIFEFRNGLKEVVFGWTFPGAPHGPAFASRNERVVTFFENYFTHFFNQCCVPEAELTATVQRGQQA